MSSPLGSIAADWNGAIDEERKINPLAESGSILQKAGGHARKSKQLAMVGGNGPVERHELLVSGVASAIAMCVSVAVR
jgi:hypothetical protein